MLYIFILNMKLAVIVRTYWRKNNTSKKHLLKMFNVLYNQSYQDFKLFLIGDCYEKKEEFKEICQLYKNEIYYENLNIHFRNIFKIKRNRWTCGGSNANYYALKKAIDEKYDYYIHLDDDDTWTNNHIEEIVDTIKKFPEVDFIASKSRYMNGILPREHKQINKKFYNNWLPNPCNVVHSSWCINLNTFGQKLLNIYKQRINIVNLIRTKKIKERLLGPLDAHILNIINQNQKNNSIKSILIPIVTCIKLSDVNIPQ